MDFIFGHGQNSGYPDPMKPNLLPFFFFLLIIRLLCTSVTCLIHIFFKHVHAAKRNYKKQQQGNQILDSTL